MTYKMYTSNIDTYNIFVDSCRTYEMHTSNIDKDSFFLLTALLCSARILYLVNSLPHFPQGYWPSSWIDLLCLARLLWPVNFLPQSPKGYFNLSCTALQCIARTFWVVNCLPHCPQGYFTPSWTALLCSARSPLVVNCLPHCPKFLQELLFCVMQDYSDLLTICHIVRTDIWLLHELLFSDLQEHPD